MKKLSIILEIAGITCLCIVINMGWHNPSIYLAIVGSALIASGGFLWNKTRK